MRRSFFKQSVIGAASLLVLFSAIVSVTAAAPANESPGASVGTPVDLNTATVLQLTEIPGIGPVTAERIVAWRETNGPFLRVEDLMKVKGIGEKSLEKIRPYVKVSKVR